MGELVIKYHDFENAKKEIKKFSEQTTTNLDLKRVENSKGVGEFLGEFFLGGGIGLNHKVTGEELNELTSQIQSHLHSINSTQIKLIKEFGQVYSALEALDKDYIQAILVSIKATEETSQSIQETQDQIKKIVENQRKTLEELKKFKQKLDGYAHMGDIDKIWSDCQKWREKINVLSKAIDNAAESSRESAKKTDAVKTAMTVTEKKIDDLFKQVNWQIERIESIITFTSALEEITHLQDIDEMWESLSSAHDSLQNIGNELTLIKSSVSNYQEDIDTLLTFMEKLSKLKHLSDVDAIWGSVENHSAQLSELEKQSGEIKNIIRANKDDATAAITSAIEQSNTAVERLTKKIKYAYLLAGCAVGLAIVELIVILMKVI